ncbi:hypothetical protein PVAND_010889 [Polypedilum vanderplanki]|uniref:Pyroglutamyl-peptidase 1 n=1 Tax=Polypedilum vanderplanki TaxID=319348 RepID=A0A9J6CHV6_POLVA|nr:hypothetical protein PVAND_010889 [Polypedilum vanderplanki]
MESKNRIIVTGYDVFEGHERKNASWEAVNILPKEIKIDDKKFKIKKLKVEVKYAAVDKIVEEIWKKDPYLVVHVGVHGYASKIKIEKCAINEFPMRDYASKTLNNPVLCLENAGKCDILHTKIDVDTITKYLNENHRNMYESSCDVGKYLCGYIYLKSLDKNPTKTLFIHVPCIDKPFNTKDTSAAIYKIIEQCLITPLLE